jgi:hypothetical protein
MSTDALGATPPRTHGVIELASSENEGEPALPTANQGERLEWASFRARFYPHARSHDYESLAAYIEYQKHPERARA